MLASRGALLVAWLAVVVVTVVWFARAQKPEEAGSIGVVFGTLLIDGGAAALWAASAAVGGSAVLRTLGVRARPALFVATTAGIGLGCYSLILLGLGLAGWLNGATAAGLAVGSVALSVVDLARRPPPWLAALKHSGRIDLGLARRAGGRWALLLTAIPFGLAATGGSITPGVLWKPDDPHPYDVLSYHLQIPRQWHDAGRIAPTPDNVFGFMPFNAEVHSLAAMHLRGGPWAGMFQAQFNSLAFSTLAAMAVYGALRRPLAGAVAASAFACVPWTVMLSAVAYNEPLMLLFVALALAWGLRLLRPGYARSNRVPWRPALVAGTAAGLAAGVKYPAVPILFVGWPVALAVGAALVRRVPHSGAWRRLALAAVIYGAATLAFSPWLVRNVAWTGNPVYPLAMNLLGRGDFSPAQVERWDAAHAATARDSGVAGRARALGREVLANGQYDGGMVWAFAVAAVGFSLSPRLGRGAGAPHDRSATRRTPRTAGPAVALLAFLGIVAVVWVGFTHLIGRFAVPAIPAAAVLIGSAFARRGLVPRPAHGWAVASAATLSAAMLLSCVSFVGPRLTTFADLGRRGFFGATDLSFMLPGDLTDPTDAGRPVVLVGDAGAFWYQLPPGVLRYRSVFDVAADQPSAIAAWLTPELRAAMTDPDPKRRPILVVNPMEVERLHATYRHVPPLDPDLPGPRDRTFLVR